MTEDEKARKVALMEAARKRIEAARQRHADHEDVYSEFRPGFFADRDPAWGDLFKLIEHEYQVDIDVWAQAFLDFHPVPHQRSVEAVRAWADQLPWPDDREGIEQAKMCVRMSIAMRMAHSSEQQKTYSFLEIAKLLNVKEHSIWHIIDVGEIRPHSIIDGYQDDPLPEVIDSLRFTDADVETFRQELRRRRHDDFKAEYADVYVPDEGPHARGLEFGPGWIGIVKEYCDQLRELERDHFFESLVWAKEKFGALKLFTRSSRYAITTLQSYWLSRLDERARRKSLRTCQECGQPGRLRWGAHAATLCDRHSHLVGKLRAEDGIILDPDRQQLDADGNAIDWPENFLGRYTWTDQELGLDQGASMNLAKQMEIEFRPFLSPGLQLDGTDAELADLRKKLLAIDQAIGRHHEVKFQKRARGYEIAIDNQHPMSTIDEIKRDAIVAEIQMIMAGQQV